MSLSTMTLCATRRIQWNSVITIPLLCAFLLSGCTTPDLKPFADASTVLASGVKTGGDQAILPLTSQSIWDGEKFVPPNDPNHPAKALQASWELRRQMMEAVMVYSVSLAGINDAANHRKENATQLVGAVKQLASAVPGFNFGSGAAGDLIISGLGILVELKAWHDMGKAIKTADPLIQKIAQILKADFGALSAEFESNQRNLLIQKTTALRPIERFYKKLQEARVAQRDKVEANPSDGSLGNELARIDGLIAGVLPELTTLRSDKVEIEKTLASGKTFFASVISAIDAWTLTHSDLVKAFEQHRRPNLALLAARAQELYSLIQNLRK